MLTSIEIHNFKAIKDGQDENGNITEKPLILKDLTNVNYLVGENGSGKSSVLEGIKITCVGYNDDLDNLNKLKILNQIYCFLDKNHMLNQLHQLSFKESEVRIDYKNKQNQLINIFSKIKVTKKNNYNKYQLPKEEYENLCQMMLYYTETVENERKKDQNKTWIFTKNIKRYEQLRNMINQWLLGQIKNLEDQIDIAIDNTNSSKIFLLDIHESYKPNSFLRGLVTPFSSIKHKIINEWNEAGERVLEIRENIKNEDGSNPILHFGQYNSDGEFKFDTLIDFIAHAISLAQENKENIFILEEPENNLHPKWQKLLVSFFNLNSVKKYMKSLNICFLISTHSPFIINSALELDNQKVFHLQKGELVGEVTKEDLNSFNLALDGLGVKPSDMMFANGVVWVECPTDAIYIEKWLGMYQHENLGSIKYTSGLNYQFQMYGGALLKHYTEETDLKKSITDMLKINTKRFVVFDSDIEDEEDKSTFGDYKNAVMKEIGDENFYWHDISTKTIEDYIPNMLRVEKYRTKEDKPRSGNKYKHALANIQKWEDEKPKLKDFSNLKPQITKLFEAIQSWNS